MSGRDPETLSQYVNRVMSEKGLTFKQVKQMSGGRITDSYVRRITNGKAKNPSVEKLKALALGLGVPEDDLFRIARGLASTRGPKREDDLATSYRAILALMSSCVKNRTLTELLCEVARLAPESQEEAVGLLKLINERDRVSLRKAKIG